MRHVQGIATSVAIAVLVGMLGACARSEHATDGAIPDLAQASGPPEIRSLTVGALPITDLKQLFVADALGFFEHEGLQVDIRNFGGGAEIVPAVVSGAVDLGWSNSISILQGRARGLPLRFFASRTFAVANGASLLGYGAIFGSLFLLSSLMQVRFGYGAFESGLRLLPWAGVPMLVVPLSGSMIDRFGARAVIVFGLTCSSAALAWLALAADGSYWPLVPAMVLGGIGGASLFAPITSAALGAVAPAEQGQASGATVAIRELAVVLGVAIAGSVFAAHGSFASPGEFSSGFRAAVGLMAIAALAGAALALKLRAAPDSQLAVDVPEVPLDGLGADAQAGGDLAVAPAGGGQLGHPALGGREAVAGSGA